MSARAPRVLLAAAAAAITLGAGQAPAVAAPGALPGDDPAMAAWARLTPGQKVGQLLLVAFYVPEPLYDTPEPLQEAIGLIGELGVGGLVLQKGNNVFRNARGEDLPAEIAGLAGRLQSVALGAAGPGVPLFLAVDHEGDGDPLTHLREGFTPVPSAMAIGATYDPARAEAVGRVVGSELAAVGVNMLLGPVLDVLADPRTDSGGDIGTRSFGGDPYWVQQLGAAYVRGAHRGAGGRLAVVAKHFPGHGGSDRSPDSEVATVNKSLEALREIELQPFAAVTGAAPGDPDAPHVADGLMTSHIRYRAVRPDIRSFTPPISMDREAMDALLSQPDMPFRAWRDAGGLVVADSLGVRAVRRYFDPTEQQFPHRQIARQALLAGNDVLIIAQFAADGSWQTGLGNIRDLVAYFAQQYDADPAFRSRVDEAALRVLRRKAAMYPEWTVEAVAPDPERATAATGAPESMDAMAAAARAAVTELRAVDRPRAGDALVIVADYDRDTNPRELACFEESCGLGAERSRRLADMAPTLVEALLLDRYGPGGSGAVDRARLSLVTFCQLREMARPSSRPAPAEVPGAGPTLDDTACDPDADPETVRATLSAADWIVFAFAELDPTEVRDLRGLLLPQASASAGGREETRVAALAFGPPYYVDQTNFYHLDAYYAAYSKSAASIEAMLAALYGEIDAEGALPVTYPDADMPLHERLSPDPDQSLTVRVVSGPEPPRVPATVVVEVGPILDRNGNVVPDGTEVTFGTDPAEALSRSATVVVGTTGGIGRAELELVAGARVKIVAASESALATPVAIALDPPPTPSVTADTPRPATPTAPVAAGPAGPASGRNGGLRVADLLLSLAGIVVLVGLVEGRGPLRAAPAGKRMRAGLACGVFGLAAYLAYGSALRALAVPRPGIAALGLDAVAVTVLGATLGLTAIAVASVRARRIGRTPRATEPGARR